MTKSDAIGKLAEALSKAQGRMKGAAKDSSNPFFKSRYADLASVWDACRDALADEGLSVMQPARAEGAKVTVTTLLAHASGEWLSEDLTITAKEDTPQAVGSAITYARRYGLSSMVGIAPEDDDGEAAHGRVTAPPQSVARPAPTDASAAAAKARASRAAKIWERVHAAGISADAFQGWVKEALGEPKPSGKWTDEDMAKLDAAAGKLEDVA